MAILFIVFIVFPAVVIYNRAQEEKARDAAYCASVGPFSDQDKIRLAIEDVEKSAYVWVDGTNFPKASQQNADDILAKNPDCCLIIGNSLKDGLPEGTVNVSLRYKRNYIRDGKAESITTKQEGNGGRFVDQCGRVSVD